MTLTNLIKSENYYLCSFVQNAIKDSIKEHLFGPDIVSTDDNECSPNESEPSREYSAESLEESEFDLYFRMN